MVYNKNESKILTGLTPLLCMRALNFSRTSAVLFQICCNHFVQRLNRTRCIVFMFATAWVCKRGVKEGLYSQTPYLSVVSLMTPLCFQNPGFEFSLDQHLVSKATMYDMIVDPTQKFVATACQDRNVRSVEHFLSIPTTYWLHCLWSPVLNLFPHLIWFKVVFERKLFVFLRKLTYSWGSS